jgi:hypothetical protein
VLFVETTAIAIPWLKESNISGHPDAAKVDGRCEQDQTRTRVWTAVMMTVIYFAVCLVFEIVGGLSELDISTDDTSWKKLHPGSVKCIGGNHGDIFSFGSEQQPIT